MKYMFIVSCIFCIGCAEKNGNIEDIRTPVEKNASNTREIDIFDFPLQEEVYVPIYSEIYTKNKSFAYHLTATLSIRNTSKRDSIFIRNVDYYSTDGSLVRKYLKNPIFVKPLETLEYVVREKDTLGGSGAKFLLTWGANNPVRPMFQAVMIGSFNNQVFSFSTNGIATPSIEYP